MDFTAAFGIQNALTAEAAVDARIAGAVDEIFLPIGDFRNVVLAGFEIDMAGAASANHAAVVVKLDSVVFRDLNKVLLSGDILQRNGLQAFLLEFEIDSVHETSLSASWPYGREVTTSRAGESAP